MATPTRGASVGKACADPFPTAHDAPSGDFGQVDGRRSSRCPARNCVLPNGPTRAGEDDSKPHTTQTRLRVEKAGTYKEAAIRTIPTEVASGPDATARGTAGITAAASCARPGKCRRATGERPCGDPQWFRMDRGGPVMMRSADGPWRDP